MLARLRSTRPTIVAGSTWPPDEAVLLPAIQSLRATIPDLRLIIAPHEPSTPHVSAIAEWSRHAKLKTVRLDEPGAADADVVLIDRVGVLGELYALADVAYVGGGFHSAGLHSVLEPAAFGIPVLFGPRHEGSRDAGLLAQRGGGAAVSNDAELSRRLRTWITDAAARRETGNYARALVRSGVGAADRSFELVDRLMGG